MHPRKKPRQFYGNLETLKYLIKLGGDSHVKNAQNLTLLHVAAQTDQVAIVSFLLQLGYNISE